MTGKVNIIAAADSKSREKAVKIAASLLKKGKVVIFPTDTVYGIGAMAKGKKGIASIYSIKKRTKSKALVLLIASKAAASRIAAGITGDVSKLMGTFWPGPLTMVFRQKTGDSPNGKKTIGLRMPANPVALGILRKTGPLAVTSVNISGRKPALKVADIEPSIREKAGLIIDGGNSPVGVESTVIDVTGKLFGILREGAVSKKQLERVLGKGKFK